jgi:hypothetical protein
MPNGESKRVHPADELLSECVAASRRGAISNNSPEELDYLAAPIIRRPVDEAIRASDNSEGSAIEASLKVVGYAGAAILAGASVYLTKKRLSR